MGNSRIIKETKIGIIAGTVVLAMVTLLGISSICSQAASAATSKETLEQGETYQWTYKKPFGRVADEFMTIDGKLEEEQWKGQNQLSQTENGVKVTATTVFTEKGLYIGLEAFDKNVVWNMRHNYSDNSNFKVIVTKENEAMYKKDNYDMSFPVTRHAYLQIDAKNCRSYRQTPYQGKAYVDGELNSGNTKSISAELFLSWEDLHYTQEELGADGIPDNVEIYVSYRSLDQQKGAKTIAASFTKEWQFETYFHFNQNGWVGSYDSVTVGNTADGPAASDQWELKVDANGKETATATAERLQVLWLKDFSATDFEVEVTVKPLRTKQDIYNRCGIMVYKNSGAYNIFGLRGKNITQGNSLTLKTFRETDAYHWENQPGLADETVRSGNYTEETVKLKVVKRGNSLSYYYDGVFWKSEEIDALNGACCVGLFTNGAAEFSDWSYSSNWNVKTQFRVNRSDSGLVDIRFITGIDSLNYQNAYFHIEVANAQGKVYKSGNLTERIGYTSLLENGKKVTPGEYFGTTSKYFVVHALTGIPESCIDDTFTVTTYCTELDGTTTAHETTTFTIRDKMKDMSKVTITYPDNTTETLFATRKIGLSAEPKVGYGNPFLTAYVNQEATTDLETACKNLTADATVTYSYVAKTTNTTPGTGVAMAADGKITLTGNLKTGEPYSDELNPADKQNLYTGNTMRQMMVADGTHQYSVLRAKVTASQFDGGSVGFAIEVNSTLAMVGIKKNGTVDVRSYSAGNSPADAYMEKVSAELDWGKGVDMMFVHDIATYYLFVNGELVVKFENNVNWLWGNGYVEKNVGFSQWGQNVVSFTDYTYETGTEAVRESLVIHTEVTVQYPDGTSEIIPASFNSGLAREPQIGYDNPFFTVYVNDKKVSDLQAACKYLVEDATVRYAYTSKTTYTGDNKNLGIAVAADGKITLSGRYNTNWAGLEDEKNPVDGAALWPDSTVRQVMLAHTAASPYVIKTNATVTEFKNGSVGFALEVEGKMARFEIEKNGNLSLWSYVVGGNPDGLQKYNLSSKLDWETGVELALVCNGNTYSLYVNGEIAASFENNKNWYFTNNPTARNGYVNENVGLSQRGRSTVTFTDYTYVTGQMAVNDFLDSLNQ